MRQQYGDTYRLSIPGQVTPPAGRQISSGVVEGTTVLVFRPEDGRAMYAGEGSLPNIPGFDFFQLMRERMSDRYRSTGLVTNKPEWAQV